MSRAAVAAARAPGLRVEEIRGELLQFAADYGATLARGVPAGGLPDGVYLLQLSAAEAGRFEQGDHEAPDFEAVFLDSGRRLLATILHLTGVLHRADPGVDHPPKWPDLRREFVKAFLVRDGWSVGYMILADDLLGNMWTAHTHRRQGVATELLRTLRQEFALTAVQGPASPAAVALLAKVAPDLPLKSHPHLEGLAADVAAARAAPRRGSLSTEAR